MTKSKERIIATDLRKAGKSILEIAKRLHIAKSTVSLWCRDIALTPRQINRLAHNSILGIRRGQLIGAEQKRKSRLDKVKRFRLEGVKKLENLSDDAFFAAGIALYLAEGAKTMRQVYFVNSDPRVVMFMIQWLERFFQVQRERIAPSVFINHIHRSRIQKVLRYWSFYLEIPLSQFRSTIFVKTTQKKLYKNHNNYFGTLRFRVLKSTDLFYTISGLIEGLLQHTKKPA